MKTNRYILDIGKILSGVMLVNVLTLITLPVITRIYDPEVFGKYQALLALILTLSSVSTLKYELAIVIPKTRNSAVEIVRLVFLILLAATGSCFLLVFFVKDWIGAYLKVPDYAVWLLPFLVFLTAGKPLYQYWYTRNQRYGMLSKNNVAEQLFNRPLMIMFGYLNPSIFSLVGAYGLSKIFTTVNLAVHSKINLLKFQKKSLITNFVHYKKFPLYLTPATFANVLATQAPLLLLGYYFSPAIVGYYAIVQRLTNLPMSLTQQSMGQVYYERAAKEINSHGHATSITLRTLFILVTAATAGGLFLYFFGASILTFFLGSRYAESGHYLVLLIPLFLFRLIKAPLNYWTLVNKQEITLGLHLVQLIFTGISFLLFHETAVQTIFAYSLFMAGYYFINVMLIVQHCLKMKKEHAEEAGQ